jgi:hypothetical protein
MILTGNRNRFSRKSHVGVVNFHIGIVPRKIWARFELSSANRLTILSDSIWDRFTNVFYFRDRCVCCEVPRDFSKVLNLVLALEY